MKKNTMKMGVAMLLTCFLVSISFISSAVANNPSLSKKLSSQATLSIKRCKATSCAIKAIRKVNNNISGKRDYITVQAGLARLNRLLKSAPNEKKFLGSQCTTACSKKDKKLDKQAKKDFKAAQKKYYKQLKSEISRSKSMLKADFEKPFKSIYNANYYKNLTPDAKKGWW